MLLESFVAVNSAMLATRAIHTKVDDEMKEKITNEGLYHVTSEESAEKIMESGYIKPSSNFLSLGRKKCFFFAGSPSYKDLSSNCASEATKYEFKAVKLIPTTEEMNNFRQRSWNDDSITYVGKCMLPEDRVKVVDLVLDLDKNGKIYTREKTEEELEKYEPSKELTEKMASMKKTSSVMGKAYFNEYVTVASKLKKNLSKIKDKIFGKKQLMLDNGNEIEKNNINNVATNQDNFMDELKDSTYSLSLDDSNEISNNYEEKDFQKESRDQEEVEM